MRLEDAGLAMWLNCRKEEAEEAGSSWWYLAQLGGNHSGQGLEYDSVSSGMSRAASAKQRCSRSVNGYD